MKRHLWVVEFDGEPSCQPCSDIDVAAYHTKAEARKAAKALRSELREFFPENSGKYRVVKYVPNEEKT